MKELQVLILIYFSIPIFGQIDNDIFEFENITFDSIIVYSDSHYNSNVAKEIFQISNGKIYSSKTWLNGKLVEISKHKYHNGKLHKTEKFECEYSFDSLGNMEIGEMNFNKSTGKMYKYENNRLSKTISYELDEGIYNIRNKTFFKYDSGRIIEEVILNPWNNDFKTNTYSYKYLSDTILIDVHIDGDYSGYQIITGSLEIPNEIKSYLPNGELIRHLIYVRNSNGNVIERYYKLHTYKSFGGGEVDFAGYKKTKIKYNEEGFPIEVKYFVENGLSDRRRYVYYTP